MPSPYRRSTASKPPSPGHRPPFIAFTMVNPLLIVFTMVNRCPQPDTIIGKIAIPLTPTRNALRCRGLRLNRCPVGHPLSRTHPDSVPLEDHSPSQFPAVPSVIDRIYHHAPVAPYAFGIRCHCRITPLSRTHPDSGCDWWIIRCCGLADGVRRTQIYS